MLDTNRIRLTLRPHIPYWMKFEGGRAQASTIGMMVVIHPYYNIPMVVLIFGILFAHSDRHPKRQDGRQDVKANPRQVQGNYHGCGRYIRATGIYDARAVQSQQNVHEASPASRTSVHHRSYHHNGACGVAFRHYFSKARKKKIEAFWTEEYASRESSKSPCLEYAKGCAICRLCKKYEHQNPQGGMETEGIRFPVGNDGKQCRVVPSPSTTAVEDFGDVDDTKPDSALP